MNRSVRLYKHPQSSGDVGDCYLYLEALVQVIPDAERDLAEIVEVYAEKSHVDMVLRARLGFESAPKGKKALVKYQGLYRKFKEDLKAKPFQIYSVINRLLPSDAKAEAMEDLRLATFHSATVKAVEGFHRRWLNESTKGLQALQLFLAYSTCREMGLDLSDTFQDKPVLSQLIYGNEKRSKSRQGRREQEIVTETRKLWAKSGYKNKAGHLRLEHAKLAVKVMYVYHGNLEETVKREVGNKDCPTDASNLSKLIAPFYKALEAPLKRGPKPFEGDSPIHLAERIRLSPTSVKDWISRRK